MLAAAMDEFGVTRAHLAEMVNAAVAHRTGEPGDASERWVYYLLSGAIRWPRHRHRLAIEDVFGVSILDLGFVPPAGVHRHRRRLDRERAALGGSAVDRRQFLITAGSAAVAIALPDFTGRVRLGRSDVERLREPLARLVALDDRQGGATLAPVATAMVQQIEAALARCQVADPVRRAMYSLAGEYLASAGWFAIDADDLPAASRYLDHALRASVIGRDAMVQAQIWNAMAWRADQANDHGEVLAIAQSALVSTASRRDPRVAALWHGWSAQGHAWAGYKRLSERSIGRAQEALDRADAGTPTPPWLAFLDHSEIHAQAAGSQLVLGDYAVAQSAASAAVRGTPDRYLRNRVSRQMRLAQAYLGQREVEPAADVASIVLDRAGDLRSGRLARRQRSLFDQFAAWESDVPAAAVWTQRYRAQVQAS